VAGSAGDRGGYHGDYGEVFVEGKGGYQTLEPVRV